MRFDNKSINVKKVSTNERRRVKRSVADELTKNGKWVFISNSEYREHCGKKQLVQKEAVNNLQEKVLPAFLAAGEALAQESEVSMEETETQAVKKEKVTRQGKNKKAKKAKG